MKVLFIGGTGNISTACVARALERGHEVTILTRGKRPPSDARVKTVVGDRDDERVLRDAAAAVRYDAVVDFVAYRPEQVDAVARALAGRVGQYVFISSTVVYQRPPVPYAFTEDMPQRNAHWEYARLKIECEARLRRASGLPVTIVRPSYTYGPTWIPSGFGGQDYTVVDRMRRGQPIVCHGDGTALWVMTAASDFAAGLVGLLGLPAATGEAFHVTSDEVLCWTQIYGAMAAAAGCEPKLVYVPSALIAHLFPEKGGSLLGDKAWSAVFDNAKIKRFVPEYRATIPFAEGIKGSIAWYDADPARRAVNEEANRAIDRVIAAQQRAYSG